MISKRCWLVLWLLWRPSVRVCDAAGAAVGRWGLELSLFECVEGEGGGAVRLLLLLSPLSWALPGSSRPARAVPATDSPGWATPTTAQSVRPGAPRRAVPTPPTPTPSAPFSPTADGGALSREEQAQETEGNNKGEEREEGARRQNGLECPGRPPLSHTSRTNARGPSVPTAVENPAAAAVGHSTAAGGHWATDGNVDNIDGGGGVARVHQSSEREALRTVAESPQ